MGRIREDELFLRASMSDKRNAFLTVPPKAGVSGYITKFWQKARMRRPPLIDRGLDLIYDVERDITWLKDANYAKTMGRAPDGQLSWDDAMSWVADLEYCGIRGWRLPTALDPGEGEPYVGYNCVRGELGHLFNVGSKMPHGSISVENLWPFSTYWTSTEFSPTEVYGFKLSGLRQGTIEKDLSVAVADLVLAWPVHNGDVYAQLVPS